MTSERTAEVIVNASASASTSDGFTQRQRHVYLLPFSVDESTGCAEVVVVKRCDWRTGLIGGCIDGEETWNEALGREVREELGLPVNIGTGGEWLMPVRPPAILTHVTAFDHRSESGWLTHNAVWALRLTSTARFIDACHLCPDEHYGILRLPVSVRADAPPFMKAAVLRAWTSEVFAAPAARALRDTIHTTIIPLLAAAATDHLGTSAAATMAIPGIRAIAARIPVTP